MFDKKTASTADASGLKPAIICTADLSYYLIGAEDANGKFYNIYSNDTSQPLFAHSLEQAKRVLKAKLTEQYGQQGEHQQVIVELKNPYDEMIGTQSYGPTRMLVKLTCEV